MTQDYEFDIEYVEADIFDCDNDIYVYATYPNMPKYLPNTYNLACRNLPLGSYSLKGKHIDLHFDTIFKLAHTDDNFLDVRYTESDVFNFIVRETRDRILLQVKKCNRKNIENIVKDLRRQLILKQKQLGQDNQTLIQKDIKSHTDLGEDYNRESFYDTIWECVDIDETLDVDLTKSPKDKDINLLHFAKLMQDKSRLSAKQKELDKEKAELHQREIELMKL